jgi:hypothetical protein
MNDKENMTDSNIDEWLESKFKESEDIPEEEKKEIDAMMNNVLMVRSAIREKHPKGKEFVTDSIPCPICEDGTVEFIISDHVNGHIHAHCSTEHCVNWME